MSVPIIQVIVLRPYDADPMQLPSLLVSAAAPVAFHTVKSVACLASAVGQSFAQVFNEAGGAENGVAGDAVSGLAADGRPTLSEQLGEIASRLRDWLGKQGLRGPFELNLSVDAAGTEQLEFASPEVATGPSLLEQNPKLLQELSRLAASLQAATMGLASGSVHLRISDSDSQARVL